MRIAIFDDEAEVAKIIGEEVLAIEQSGDVYIESVDCFSETPGENIEEYDVVLMDIEWNRENNGIDLANKIYHKYPRTQIIFVTGYNDRFSQDIFGQRTNLCGYLVKPIERERLSFLLKKADQNIKKNKSKEIVIKNGSDVEIIQTDLISYIESRAHKLIIRFLDNIDKEMIVYAKMDEYEEKVKEDFIRTHKSYLVNAMHVKRIETNCIVLKDNSVIPISKRNATEAREKFFRYMKERIR